MPDRTFSSEEWRHQLAELMKTFVIFHRKKYFNWYNDSILWNKSYVEGSYLERDSDLEDNNASKTSFCLVVSQFITDKDPQHVKLIEFT